MESFFIHDIEEDIRIRINSCGIIKQENTKLGNIIGKLSGNKLRCGEISRHARPRSLVLKNKREGANPSISTNGAVVELVDTQDLIESLEHRAINPVVRKDREGSTPSRPTKPREVNPRMRMLWGMGPYFDGVILGSLKWPCAGTGIQRWLKPTGP